MVAMTAACSSGGGQTQAPSQAVEAGKDTAGGAEKDTAGGAGNAAAGGAENDAAGGVTSAGSKEAGQSWTLHSAMWLLPAIPRTLPTGHLRIR